MLLGATKALRNVSDVELIGMPKLTKCKLLSAFKSVNSVRMENAGKLEEIPVLKEKNEERVKSEVSMEEIEEEVTEDEQSVNEETSEKEEVLNVVIGGEEVERVESEAAETVQSVSMESASKEGDLDNTTSITALSKSDLEVDDNCFEAIVVDTNGCNDDDLTELDLGRFPSLIEFRVNDNSFKNVTEVNVTGLHHLERVIIGTKCFMGSNCIDSLRPLHFYLKNCERLKELKVGCYSFKDYSVCEIESVDSLEVIEMGELGQWSGNFQYASLTLKSACQRRK